MRIAAIAIALLYSIISQSIAANGTECARIGDGNKRLLCYDLIFRKSEITQIPAGDTGKWKHYSGTSKIDDSKSVFLSLQSTNEIAGKYGRPKRGTIRLRCFENTTSVNIAFGDYFMSDIQGYGRVTYRIDRKPAATVNMTESTDHSVLGLWNGGRSIPFIKRLFGTSLLVLRATPYSESTQTLEFATGGIDEAIKPLREACGW